MIDILLATYNGEQWLEQQIESLLLQTFNDWRLLVRDDGSTDGTLEVLQAQQHRLGDRMEIIEDGEGNLGPSGNFLRLLEASTAEYIMFCDQDDIWFPEKMSLTLAKMRDIEADCGVKTPVLVHTDFQVVDDNLNLLAKSGHRYQKINPEKGGRFSRLLVQNIATGCTIMANRALCDRAMPIPGAALMHDHWMCLAAACFGKVSCLSQPTLLYRQHENNKVGACGWSPAYVFRLLFQVDDIRASMHRNRTQADAFYRQYEADLLRRDRSLLEAFIHMPERGPLERRRDILHYNFFYCGAIRNMGWLLLC